MTPNRHLKSCSCTFFEAKAQKCMHCVCIFISFFQLFNLIIFHLLYLIILTFHEAFCFLTGRNEIQDCSLWPSRVIPHFPPLHSVPTWRFERPPVLNTHRGRGLLQSLASEGGHVIDDGGEVGGAIELDLRETRPVRLHHALDSCKNTVHNPGKSLPHCRIFSKGAAGSRSDKPAQNGCEGLKLSGNSWETCEDTSLLLC